MVLCLGTLWCLPTVLPWQAVGQASSHQSSRACKFLAPAAAALCALLLLCLLCSGLLTASPRLAASLLHTCIQTFRRAERSFSFLLLTPVSASCLVLRPSSLFVRLVRPNLHLCVASRRLFAPRCRTAFDSSSVRAPLPRPCLSHPAGRA